MCIIALGHLGEALADQFVFMCQSETTQPAVADMIFGSFDLGHLFVFMWYGQCLGVVQELLFFILFDEMMEVIMWTGVFADVMFLASYSEPMTWAGCSCSPTVPRRGIMCQQQQSFITRV